MPPILLDNEAAPLDLPAGVYMARLRRLYGRAGVARIISRSGGLGELRRGGSALLHHAGGKVVLRCAEGMDTAVVSLERLGD